MKNERDLQVYAALQLGEVYDLVEDKLYLIKEAIGEAEEKGLEVNEDAQYAIKLLRKVLIVLD